MRKVSFLGIALFISLFSLAGVGVAWDFKQPRQQGAPVPFDRYAVYYGDFERDLYQDLYFHGVTSKEPLSGIEEILAEQRISPPGFAYFGAPEGGYQAASPWDMTEEALQACRTCALAQAGVDYVIGDMDGDGIPEILVKGRDVNHSSVLISGLDDGNLPRILLEILPTGHLRVPGRESSREPYFRNNLRDADVRIVSGQLWVDGAGHNLNQMRLAAGNNQATTSKSLTTQTLTELSGTASTVSAMNIPAPPTPFLPTHNLTVAQMAEIDAMGGVGGEFRVNEMGAATYTVPIALPIGTAGVTPEIALAYSSQAGIGNMGLGWSLQAGGAISRCRQTLQVDGVALAIQFNDQDRFCLDGQRLLVTSGTYGAAGAQYKTEIDAGLVVTSFGGAAGHPDYFEVTAKDGSTSRYGGSGNHNAEQRGRNISGALLTNRTLNWGLSEFRDSVGNKIVYTYESTAQYFHLSSIAYGYGSGTTADVQVSFQYGTRKKSEIDWVKDSRFEDSSRLDSIQVRDKTLLVREYRIGYNLASAGALNDLADRVTSIDNCLESVCAQPLRLSWGFPSPGAASKGNGKVTTYSNNLFSFGTTGFTANGHPTEKIASGDRTIPVWSVSNLALVALGTGQTVHSYQEGDIDGDGRSDLLILRANTSGTKNFTLFTRLQTETGFTGSLLLETLPGDPTAVGAAQDPRLFPVDFNADGRLDLAIYLPASDSWRTYFSEPQTTGSWKLVRVDNFLPANIPDNLRLADINSDGLPDLIYARDNKLFVHYIKRTGADTSSRAYTYSASYDFNADMPNFNADSLSVAFDFNEDGRTDFLSSNVTSSIAGNDFLDVCRSSVKLTGLISGGANAFHQFSQPVIEVDWYVPDATFCSNDVYTVKLIQSRMIGPKFLDIDHDGLLDMILAVRNINIEPEFFQSISYKRGMPNQQFAETQTFTFNFKARNFELLDTDSDGDHDLLITGQDDAQWIARWNGATFDAPIVHMAAQAGRQTRYTDINEDGIVDRLTLQGGQLTVVRGRPRSNDVVVRFETGLGAVTGVFYEPLRDSNRYQRLLGVQNVQTGTSPSGSYCPPDGSTCITWPGQPVYSVDSSQFYSQINNPFAGVELETDLQLHRNVPAQEWISSVPVVTRVVSSAPTAANASQLAGIDYRYEGLKVQAGGRGMLGFRKLMTTDMQTGVVTTTEYRQDWPFLGTPVRTFVTTRHGQLMLESTSKTRIRGFTMANIADKRTLAKNGTVNLGPLVLYTQETRDITYSVPQELLVMPDGTQSSPMLTQNKLKEIVTTTQVDANNNITQLNISTLAGDGFVAQTVNTVNTYYSGDGERYGRVLRSVVTTSRAGEAAKISTAEFSYNGYPAGYSGAPADCPAGALTGLLCSEKVSTADIRNSEAPLMTQHFYDSRGNKTHTRTGTRISPFIQYDSKGRYVQSTYDVFTSGTFTTDTAPIGYVAPTGAVVIKTNEVVERDKFGNALRSRSRIGQTTWMDQVQAATPMGTVFFNGDGTGAFEQTYLLRTMTDANCVFGTMFTKTVARAGGAQVTECHDKIGRVIGGYKASLQGTTIRTRQDYDVLGRVVRIYEPALGAAPSINTDTTYDVLGRPVLVTHPFFITDAIGTEDTTAPAISRYGYFGFITEITQSGHAGGSDRNKTEIRHITGELRFAIEGDRAIRHEYDSQGNLTLTRDHGGNDTVIIYNGLGQKIEMQDHNKGTWAYRYNAYGDLYQQVDAKGTVTTFVYDFKGRKIREEVRPASGSGLMSFDLRWEYDRGANGLGQINRESKTNTSGTAEFVRQTTFDGFGRGAQTSTQFAGANGQMETHYQKVTFDQFGRLYQSFDAARAGTDVTRNATENIYNERGYLTTVRDATNPSSIYYNIFLTHQNGNVWAMNYGSGESVIYGYHPRTGFLTDIYRSDALGSTQTYKAVWDHFGNMISRQDSLMGNTIETFQYDQYNRLTRNTLSGVSVTVSYNTMDNITSKSDVEAGAIYQYHATKKHALARVGNREFDYDANGNVTQERRNGAVEKILTYTGNDLVQRITHKGHTSEFFYGPDNQRYKRVDTDSSNNRTVTLYIGSVEKIQYHDGVVEWKRQIGDVAQITHRVTNGTPEAGTTQYFHKDHLGSIVAITNGSGTVLQRMAFDPWGARRTINSSNVWQAGNMTQSSILASYARTKKPHTSRGYTGHEMLDEVGIIHMNGRIYDAYLARFLQADPFIQDPTLPASLNRYSYVMNNPMNAADPTGYWSLRKTLKKAFKNVRQWATGGFISTDWFKDGFRSTARVLGPEVSSFLVAVGSAFCGPAASVCAAVGTYNVSRAFGATSSEAFKAGAIAGASTFAFRKIGQTFKGDAGLLAKNGPIHILSHATVGGVSSVLQGGKFGHGFFSAGITKGLTPTIAGIDGWMIGDVSVMQAAVAGLIGGTISDVTGGKFANGFNTATFGNIFNQQMSAAAARKAEQARHRLAVKTIQKYMERSNREGREYGGLIYEDEKGRLGVALAQPGDTCTSGAGCSVNVHDVKLPDNITVVASWHTHPAGWDPLFSPDDISEINGWPYPGAYLGSNDGNVYYYRVGTIDSDGFNIIAEWKIRQASEIVGRSRR